MSKRPADFAQRQPVVSCCVFLQVLCVVLRCLIELVLVQEVYSVVRVECGRLSHDRPTQAQQRQQRHKGDLV